MEDIGVKEVSIMGKFKYWMIFVDKRLTKNIMLSLSLTIVILIVLSSPCIGEVIFEVALDDHETPLPAAGGYYNLTGGDRGTLNDNDVDYSWDEESYTAEVVNNSDTWGGMWYSPVRVIRDNVPLDFRAIFGPYIRSEYQGQIIGAEILVSRANSPSNNTSLELKFELKDELGASVYAESWSDLIPGTYPKTYAASFNPSDIGSVKEILWLIEHAETGDSVAIDRIRLHASVPEMPTEEQAFLWSYSWLMANYDPDSGMVQDRSNFGAGDMENVTATAKAAKLSYYAYQKGYVSYDDANAIISKIADTLINIVPRGPSGVNTLWPHFTKLGGTELLDNAEWASGDTAYAALDIITALQMLGDPQDQLDSLIQFAQNIDWEALLLENGGLSHGYDYQGALIPYGWKSFGMETIGIAWAYASATGNIAVMDPPPSDNGSGFIDNAHYPIVLSGKDYWCNDWDEYRNTMADTQIAWYCSSEHANEFLCKTGLFGLSAAEPPEGDAYVAYGVGGKTTGPEDGNSEVIILHYSGMAADIRPEESRHLWEVLRDRNPELLPESLHDKVIISPLNNMESMRIEKTSGEGTINHLKGSWNLALQAEGWAYSDPLAKNALLAAIQENDFLNSGYRLLQRPAGPEIFLKQGTTEIPDNSSYEIGDVEIGSGITTTFTIENAGSSNLMLNGNPLIQISGSHAEDFEVLQQPESSKIEPCSFESFVIQFTPNAIGIRKVIVSIFNNDADENSYTFTLIGNGTSSTPAPTPTPTSAIPEPDTLFFFISGLSGIFTLMAWKKLRRKQ